MRKLMHGAISFDSAKLQGLPRLVQVLRAAVTPYLKNVLGLPLESAPVIQPEGMEIHPSMGLGGTRQITAHDMLSLADLVSMSTAS